jgi:hypothetical protein
MEKIESEELIDSGTGHSYLTRCVAIITILHERGIIDELLESGRITMEEVDLRVSQLERNFPGFRTLSANQQREE